MNYQINVMEIDVSEKSTTYTINDIENGNEIQKQYEEHMRTLNESYDEYLRDLEEHQEQHLEEVEKNMSPYPFNNRDPRPFQPCLHDSCSECIGTGRKKDGSICVHMISCPCPKCTPYSMESSL